ncbi:hypothetical protein [Microbacterium foliorum]|uniref:hypothetical protein n=1 Tax=Microbacterium foliorum TaxID=104336 RepID=UPI001D59ABF4|nr:hypothetical protein [Microbacterium foliorum]CAH0137932.1 hypothetical protein SRABI03_00440 [Microbacterium foliorum]CAH0209119.1 hypothetical protein SRABI44_02123 [Microbacterium foliorum]
MTSEPSPSPGVPWLVIDSPLLVVSDGGWQTLISVLALAVSAWTLFYTLTARPRVSAVVQRWTYKSGGQEVPDGDDVTVMNTGRAPVIVKSISAIGPDGAESAATKSKRGPSREVVTLPTFPLVVEPGKVLTVWMPVLLHGAEASHTHGFKINYLVRPLFRAKARVRALIVKGDPPKP